VQGLAAEGAPVESTDVLRLADITGSGPVAPVGASYVVIGLNANLTAERRLQVGSSLSLTDSGVNADVTLNAIQDIRAAASPTFVGLSLTGLAAGVDNTVLVMDGNVVKTDEIDPKVWAIDLVDYSGAPENNWLATWTGDGTIQGESNLTFDGSVLGVTGNVDISGDYLLTNGNYVGISAAERLEFYTAGYAAFMGCDVGVGIAEPDGKLNIVDSGAVYTELYVDTYSSSHVNYGPVLKFRRSFSNTLGTKTDTTDGSLLGAIHFGGVDTSQGFDTGGQIRAIQDGNAGAFLPTNLIFETWSATAVNSNQLVLYNDGNVGIRTAEPSKPLEIYVAAEDEIRVRRTNASAVDDSDQVGIRFMHRSDTDVKSGAIYAEEEQSWANRVGLAFYVYDSGGLQFREGMRLDGLGRLGIGEAAPDKLWTLADEGDAGSKTFSAGWAGTGWYIDWLSDHKYHLELESMTIRGALNVYELIINTIHSVDGGMIISKGHARVASVTGTHPNETIVLEDPSGHGASPFLKGDIVMVQRVAIDESSVVRKEQRQVKENYVSGLTMTLEATAGGEDNANIQAGDVLVVLGNIEGADGVAGRDASIFLSASETNNPFIRFKDGVHSIAEWNGVTKIVTALGNLNGVYGYDSEVHGFAAGDPAHEYVTIDPTNGFRILDGGQGDVVMLQASASTLSVGSNFVYTTADTTLLVAGWTVDTSAITKLADNVGVNIDAENSKIQIGDLDEQHVDLLGADGSVVWYKSDGEGGATECVRIDDDIWSGAPGIRVTDGILNMDAPGAAASGHVTLGGPNSVPGIVFGTVTNNYRADIRREPAGLVLISHADTSLPTVHSTRAYIQIYDAGNIKIHPIAGDDILLEGIVKAPNGAVGAPAYTFAGDPDTGIYLETADLMTIAVGGANVVSFSNTQLANFSGDVYIYDNCSALSFTDRPGTYKGVPLVELDHMTLNDLGDGIKEINYATMPIQIYAKGERKMGDHIDFNTIIAKELHARIVDLETEVSILKQQIAIA